MTLGWVFFWCVVLPPLGFIFLIINWDKVKDYKAHPDSVMGLVASKSHESKLQIEILEIELQIKKSELEKLRGKHV
jgi:hypothetical protein